MLSNDHFYWQMFRKYVVSFAHIISDIHVIRTDSNNIAVKDITVPITYAAKSKLFYHLQRKSSAGKRIRTTLPRISFIISAMEFDQTRKVNSLNECAFTTESGEQTFQYSGIPYNFTITLSMWTAYMDDMLQIIEQLATFFKPDFSMNVKEIDELGLTRSIPTIMNGIDFDFETEFEETDRVLKADATFTLKGYLYPPINDSSVIEHINVRMNDMRTGETLETIEIDWDRINERIVTEINTGKPYFEMTTNVDINTSAICDN